MQTQYYVARKYRHLNYHYLTVQLLSETPELPIANIGGGTWGEALLGALAPTKFNAGGQCPHKILHWQVHYSGACDRPISEEVTYVA